MNLLAHALLSPADPAILVGNLTADWVKGRARLQLPPPMRMGMALHQRIDVYTDSHPQVEACGNLLYPQWGRYAPILVDILFDHVLSCVWDDHSRRPRAEFIAGVYAALRNHLHHLPARAQHLLADDWLTCYASLDGIALCLTRVSRRLRFTGHDVELAPAVADFQHHRHLFLDAFSDFFPELRRHAEESVPLSVA